MMRRDIIDEHVLEGDAFWHDGWQLTPYRIKCDDGSQYWRVFVKKDGQEWSRTNPQREMAIQLAKESIRDKQLGIGSE